MLKTGSNILADQLPLHFDSTFNNFPSYTIYSDQEDTFRGTQIFDALALLPENVLAHEQLQAYNRVRSAKAKNSVGDDAVFTRKEGWNLDKFKNMPILLHAYENAPKARWYMMIDSDTYLVHTAIMNLLQQFDHRESIYLGSPASAYFHPLNGKNPQVFAHGGSGFILSRGALDRLFSPEIGAPVDENGDRLEKVSAARLVELESHEVLNICCGDMIVGHALYNFADTKLYKPAPESSDINPQIGFQGDPIAKVDINSENWCQPIYTFHHSHDEDLHKLKHLELQRDGVPLYKDVYDSFILPFASEKVHNWRFSDAEWEADPDAPLKIEGNRPINATASAENCEKACVHANCTIWTFSPGLCEHLRWTFKVGEVTNSSEGVVSGFHQFGFGECPSI